MGTGGSATIFRAALGGGLWYSTRESAGAWTDDTTEFPAVMILVDDQIAVTGGAASGGGPIINAGGGGGIISA